MLLKGEGSHQEVWVRLKISIEDGDVVIVRQQIQALQSQAALQIRTCFQT